jgi:hypothetical protein
MARARMSAVSAPPARDRRAATVGWKRSETLEGGVVVRGDAHISGSFRASATAVSFGGKCEFAAGASPD